MTPFFSEDGGPASVQAVIAAANTSGTHGARPAATADNAGNLYFETDTLQLFMSRATSWLQIASFAPPSVPSGSIVDFASTVAPSGWLICDGSAIDRTANAALFNAIGTKFGTGDGTTTFNIPDFRNRVSIGSDSWILGQAGGESTHTLVTSEMPSHNHGGHTDYANAAASGSLQTNATTANASNGYDFSVCTQADSGYHQHPIPLDGYDTPHNNMQPFLSMNKIIKL